MATASWSTGGHRPFVLGWRRSSQMVSGAQPELPRARLRGPAAPATQPARPGWPNSRAAVCRWWTASSSSVIVEEQPRWLAFLNSQHDFSGARARGFHHLAGRNRPQAGAQPAKRGMRAEFTVPQPDGRHADHLQHGRPGGGRLTPDKVALRRAIALAYDVRKEIRLARRGGTAIPAHRLVVPGTTGFDPTFRRR